MQSIARSTIVAALALIGALLLAACSAVQGSGRVISEDRALSGFSAVEINGSGTLLISQGEAAALTISGDDNILPLIESEVRGDTLVLGPRSGSNLNFSSKLTYELTVTELSAVTLNGAGDIQADQIDTDQLRVALNGAGNWIATGSVDALEVQIAGSGSFKSPDLLSQTASVDISGHGDVVVQASEALDVTISGSGSVYYIGSPTITQQISGSGKIAPQ